MNLIVIHWLDGHTEKGTTMDFTPAKDRFHLVLEDAPAGSHPKEVLHKDLKGVFFVRKLEGDPGHAKSNLFDSQHPPVGRRLRVRFKDGEVLVGTTQGYQPERPGFFVVPADPKSNNERCYLLSSAVAEVTFLS